ncbi:unnamed protein product [Paramecium primaurelia]|uniref:RING-type E3 ubiquitin transferase n=1 Tax=Paramecium primaurelia TaxID=5886 RepID=A0A8S1P6Q6_PARPR|nr:unnamed protein product [Paramecium primaurelia]
MNKFLKKWTEADTYINDNIQNIQRELLAVILPNDQSFSNWENSKTKFQSTCGYFISDQELSFQCFTCGKEPTHMICKNCFIPKLHRDHQCIIDVKNKGLCDCGVKSLILDDGFCSKHTDKININKEKEISKIPINIQNNITFIFQELINSFRSSIKEIKKMNVSNLQTTLLTLYHFAKQFKDQNSIQYMEMYQKNEQISELFRRIANINTLIFTTIELLIDKRQNYQLLIQQILSNKNLINSKYTILEKLFRYQIYIEVYQKGYDYKIDQILYKLFNDETFKAYIFSIILKNFSNFWLISQFKTTIIDEKIEELFKKIDQSMIQNQKTYFCCQTIVQYKVQNIDLYSQYRRIQKQIQPLIKHLISNRQLFHSVKTSKILISESQFQSFEMQEQFFSQNQNIQDFVVTIQQLHYTSGALCSDNQLILPQLFKKRFEYKNFGEIALGQLQNILNKNFDSFKQIDINIDIIKVFNFNKFAITNLILSLGKGIQMRNKTNLLNNSIILADTIYYLQDQATYYTAIYTGLMNLFSNQYSNEILEKNIIKLLFYQTYFILKKTININQINIKPSQSLIQDLPTIKNGMIIQKLFISYLSYLYCVTQFENGKQFLHYLIDILDEDQQNFEKILNQLLKETVYVHLIIQENQDQQIKSVYQGNNNHTEYSQFHRVDTCLIKLYIFLFDVNGFSSVKNMMEEFYQIQNGTILQELKKEKYQNFYQMFINLILTDYDLYNVCCPLLTQLTNELKLSLVRILGNYFNISTFIEYGDIQEKLKNFGVLITSNFSNHILQICEVDQTSKKLKLKGEYKIFYEPCLIQNQSQLQTQIEERLFEQKKSDSEILLGNGITWDIEQFSNKSYRVLMQQLLKIYCHFELFLRNLIYLMKKDKLIVQISYLIYAQLAYLNQFDQQLFKQYFEIVIAQLEEIQQIINVKQKQKQQIKVLIQSINELNQKQIMNNMQKQIKQKFQTLKEQYKSKFNKIQSSNLVQKMINEKEENQEEDLCFTCKLDVTTENSVGMMYIYWKSQTEFFDETHQMLKDQLLFDFDLGIQTCNHYFHDKCLTQAFDCYQIMDQEYGQGFNQYKFYCPICKLHTNCRFPISKIDKRIVKSLNSDLIFIYSLINMDDEFEDELPQQINLVKIYINLFYDLLVSLFINPQNYKKAQKNILFNQLFCCFYETIQDMNQQDIEAQPQLQNIQQKNNFLVNILTSMYEMSVKQCSLNQLRLSIIELISQYSQLNKEEISLLISSFGIEEQMMVQELNQKNKQCIHDTSLEYYQNFQIKTSQYIQKTLGETFLQFHSKYFCNKCSICKFYNLKKSKNSGVCVCLLCKDLFCNESCSLSIKDHLNYHVEKRHHGNSLFVSLQDGSVTIISQSTSIKKFKYLYYNNLGEKINIENPNSDWNQYILDITKANELVDIIVNNKYRKIIKSQQKRSNFL